MSASQQLKEPFTAMEQIANIRLADPVQASDCSLTVFACSEKRAHLTDPCVCDLGKRVALSANHSFGVGANSVLVSVVSAFRVSMHSVALALRRATLVSHVGQIVGVRTFAEVRGVYAGRVITGMHDERLRPVAPAEQVGQSVRQTRLSLHGEAAIACAYASTSPLPATYWANIDILPKPLNVFFGKLGRVYIYSIHDVNLLNRFTEWLGSFGGGITRS